MSLRDQLLKAGLVDKKQIRKANRKLKEKRRNEQSSRERQSVIKQRTVQAQTEETKVRRDHARKQRKASDLRREEANLSRLVSNLVRSYGCSIPEGRQVFFHRLPHGHTLGRLMIPLETALELRSGRLAIGWAGVESEPQLMLLPTTAAERILEREPKRILFFNAGPPDPSDPSQHLYGLDRLPAKRYR